jgi:hypothetical protein
MAARTQESSGIATIIMQSNVTSRTGLKPTLRQLMIVILWVALLSAAIRALLSVGVLGSQVDFDCLMVPLLSSAFFMPLLAPLLWLFDRAGPVRDWYRASYIAGASILSGALFLVQDPLCFALTGRPTPTFPLAAFIALVCLLAGVKQLRDAWPKLCHRCGQRAIIPIAHPARRGSKRMVNTGREGWCAICGAAYERNGIRAWRPKPAERS